MLCHFAHKILLRCPSDPHTLHLKEMRSNRYLLHQTCKLYIVMRYDTLCPMMMMMRKLSSLGSMTECLFFYWLVQKKYSSLVSMGIYQKPINWYLPINSNINNKISIKLWRSSSWGEMILKSQVGRILSKLVFLL